MTVIATANVTLQITCKPSWDDDTPVSQVRKQGVDDAYDVLNRMILSEGITHRIKMIGKPSIKVISFETGTPAPVDES